MLSTHFYFPNDTFKEGRELKVASDDPSISDDYLCQIRSGAAGSDDKFRSSYSEPHSQLPWGKLFRESLCPAYLEAGPRTTTRLSDSELRGRRLTNASVSSSRLGSSSSCSILRNRSTVVSSTASTSSDEVRVDETRSPCVRNQSRSQIFGAVNARFQEWKAQFRCMDLKRYKQLLAAASPPLVDYSRDVPRKPQSAAASTLEAASGRATTLICEQRLKALQERSLRLSVQRKGRTRLKFLERTTAQKLLSSPGFSNYVIIEKFNIPITQSVLRCLLPYEWLNDEVMNFYFSLLQARNENHLLAGHPVPKTFVWSTFFFTKLMGDDGRSYNYNSVRRWTKRRGINLFEFDLILIPVHLRHTHWTLGVVDLLGGRVYLLDSTYGNYGEEFVHHVIRYITDEYNDKVKLASVESKRPMPDLYYDPPKYSEVPQQDNGFDCGVFVCQYAECLADNRKLDFTQADIMDRRLKMAYQICTGEVE